MAALDLVNYDEAITLRTGEVSVEGKTVFIVDDDEDIGQSIGSLLRSLGYQVEVFTAPMSFLERAQAGASGCVLLDVRLPVVSGLEIQRRLREAKRTIPIIFLTAHGDIEMAVAAMKAGAAEFLPKPFREQQLIDAVADAMARSEQTEEADRIRNDYKASLLLLSPKEREVLDDLSAGLQVKEVATNRNLSPSTVRVHRRNIRSKIQGKNLGAFIMLHNTYRHQP